LNSFPARGFPVRRLLRFPRGIYLSAFRSHVPVQFHPLLLEDLFRSWESTMLAAG
jgi:hypothetical protein